MKIRAAWVAFIFAAMAAPLHVVAQPQFPTRPISLIIPAPPGGPTDSVGRVVAKALSDVLAQPVVPENRPGAGATVGTGLLAKAAPDGYTVGALANVGLTSQFGMARDVPYKLEDFTALGIVGFDVVLVSIRADSQFKSLAELVEHAKQNPKKLSYGAVGIGSTSQMAMEAVKQAFGVDLNFIPFNGAGPTLTALLGGHIDIGSAQLSSSQPFVASGRLKPLIVTSGSRLPALPEVPTVAELGKAGTPNFWVGLFVPAKTPAAVVDRLIQALAQVIRDPATATLLERTGLIVDYRSPEATRKLMTDEIKAIAELAKNMDLKQ
jgi:tripartite-type tricarboxylate transporter receptor subunit TctC